jgi:hypothetical protein
VRDGGGGIVDVKSLVDEVASGDKVAQGDNEGPSGDAIEGEEAAEPGEGTFIAGEGGVGIVVEEAGWGEAGHGRSLCDDQGMSATADENEVGHAEVIGRAGGSESRIYGQPCEKASMKQMKSSTLRMGGVVLWSQLA